MDGRDKIAETIFNLKNLALRPGSDSTEILENEESEAENSQRVSSKKRSSWSWSLALKITFYLLSVCCLVSLVSVEIQTRNIVRTSQHRILTLEERLRSSNETSRRKSEDLQKIREDLAKMRQGTEDFEDRLESELKDAEKISASQLQTFLEESNMTLCSVDKSMIHFPADGTYKMYVSLLVKGHVYPEEQIVTLSLNHVALAGGVVKVTAEDVAKEKEGGRCEGYDRGEKCVKIKHAMLVRVSAGDVVRVVQDKRNAGVILREKICVRFSDISLPANITSTAISH